MFKNQPSNAHKFSIEGETQSKFYNIIIVIKFK